MQGRAASYASTYTRAAQIQVSLGPMELGVQLEGAEETIQAWCKRIPGVARDLLAEISSHQPLLRLKGRELVEKARWPSVVRRMIRAVQVVEAESLTPMAAVAGAVSEEILVRLLEDSGERLTRAIVNNGGDMAVYSPHEPVRVGIRGTGTDEAFMREITSPEMDVPYGIATSGWRGRSFSQGIADAVVVFSSGGTVADAAATYIGNHVGDGGIKVVKRLRASEIDQSTDIPDLQVTVGCGSLRRDEKERALNNGLEAASRLFKAGLVWRVEIYLQGERVGYDVLKGDGSKRVEAGA